VTKDAKNGEQEENLNNLRNGDTGVIRFKFKYGVELVEKGAKIMVREGNTKAFGFIKEVFPMN